MKRFTESQIVQIRSMRADGYSYPEIAARFKTSKSTIFYHASCVKVSPKGRRRLETIRKKVLEKAILRRKTKIPKRYKMMTEAKARLIAHLLGDGGTYQNQISYRNSESSLIKQFVRDFRSVYGVKPWKIYWDKDKFTVGSGITEIVRDLRRYDIGEIPLQITNGSKEIQKEFIRAFADDEGGPLTRNRIRITSTNKSYLTDISRMLKNFSIHSVINGPYDAYLLDINRKESVLEFIRQIGFSHPEKVQKAKRIERLFKKDEMRAKL